MENYFINIFYWIIRIIFYYVAYENIEILDTSIIFIVTMILIYYIPNFIFNMISEFMDAANRDNK